MARIFISYSHHDRRWRQRIERQFAVLKEYGLALWSDQCIAAGDDWRPEIERVIARCDVALLLISDHFLTSPFILGEEVPPLLRRRAEQGVRVIPVILSACAWRRVGWLAPVQGRPGGDKTLADLTKPKADGVLAELACEVQDLLEGSARPGAAAAVTAPASTRVSTSHLPTGAEHFLGRKAEIKALNAAWASAGRTAIVELVAPGGVGKTSLVDEWLGRLRKSRWRGARRVYGWSFYSQGTAEDRQASEDHFLKEALDWFGVEVPDSADAWTKGQQLAEAVAASRTLLVLDGVEPLQYPPGPLAGELRAPGLKTLLEHLARSGQPGLCVVTSRERLKDLKAFERNATRPHGSVQRLELGRLDEADGAKLLHALGADHAGNAPIAAGDAELKEASCEAQGHALTLSLLGRYLALAYGGDIRKRDQVDLKEADDETGRGHAFRVMAAYEKWFEGAGEEGARELAALRLLGFFDRPAPPESLAALREAPAIEGLTEPLVELSPAQWNTTLTRLREAGLLYPAPDNGEGAAPGHLDAHPLVREYLARRLAKEQPAAWREGHSRLYEQLKASAPHHPEGLQALQPLYQAVAHGCLAGRHEEARAEVYRDRILRGTGPGGFYSTKQLGAFGADLGAVACFFDEPWQRPSPALSEPDQAWLLNAAAFCLRALGRLAEALEPMAAGAERAVVQEDWREAAIRYGNLSELYLALGRTGDALAAAEQAVAYAERSGDAAQRMSKRTTLADARHQSGEGEAAAERFREAEAMQAERQPQYPLLYSVRGFRYCDLLLAGAERAAWGAPGELGWTGECWAVAERAAQTLACVERAGWLLDIALDHLTLARCALYAARLQDERPEAAVEPAERAVAGLRAAGQQDDLPRGLLTRARLRHALDDPDGAAADLAEVRRIAERGGMRLHLADYHLHSARLFPEAPDARGHLAEARRLIVGCGYGRRMPELEDAERAAGIGLQ